MPPVAEEALHTIVVPVFDGVIAADVTQPLEVFERTQLADGSHPYEVRVASARANVDAGAFVMRPPWRFDTLARANTIIVPGPADPTQPTPPSLIRALRAAASRGTRVASICVGAFILAEAGLLDGLAATTHWAAAGDLASLYPDVDVDPNVLFVDSGRILTSAGAAAGLDLCLHIVRNDHGSDVAARTARAVVMPIERTGGQAQFINHAPPTPDGSNLAPLLAWLDTHHPENLDLNAIAAQAAMSPRTLNRRFAEQLDSTPLTWLRTIRLRRAQQLLETTNQSVESIARAVGIESATTFRANFVDLVGTSPSQYRKSFRGSARPTPTRAH